MSLNGLVTKKISAKEMEITLKYREAREVAAKSFVNARKAVADKYKKRLQDLTDEANKAGIRVDVSYDYRTEKQKASSSVNTDTPELQGILKKLEEKEEIEKAKFEKLSERAQLSALLPAKERREEMQKILDEIGAF